MSEIAWRSTPHAGPTTTQVTVDLSLVIVAVDEDAPLVQVIDARQAGIEGLPAGPFDPALHRTLDLGLRAFAAEQARVPLGYVEQLYTFGDKDRHTLDKDHDARVVSIGYLALTRLGQETGQVPEGSAWRSWYTYFPWEDFRNPTQSTLGEIRVRLADWAGAASGALRDQRLLRIRRCFGDPGASPHEDLVLDRYELLYEAMLVSEAWRDKGRSAGSAPVFGRAMAFDHRRILATAIGRLRGKLKYRPVVFELLPEAFTLTEVQRVVEAVSGVLAHKQNFRRLLETTGLVEPTGTMRADTGGRPAKAFRFRPEVIAERPAPGLNPRPGRR